MASILHIGVTQLVSQDPLSFACAHRLSLFSSCYDINTVYTRVLDLNKITIMAALPQYDRLLVLNNGSILSYSLRTFVDVAQSRVPAVNLDHTLVKITPKFSGQVNFFRVGRLNGKDMRTFINPANFTVFTTIH